MLKNVLLRECGKCLLSLSDFIYLFLVRLFE